MRILSVILTKINLRLFNQNIHLMMHQIILILSNIFLLYVVFWSCRSMDRTQSCEDWDPGSTPGWVNFFLSKIFAWKILQKFYMFSMTNSFLFYRLYAYRLLCLYKRLSVFMRLRECSSDTCLWSCDWFFTWTICFRDDSSSCKSQWETA